MNYLNFYDKFYFCGKIIKMCVTKIQIFFIEICVMFSITSITDRQAAYTLGTSHVDGFITVLVQLYFKLTRIAFPCYTNWMCIYIYIYIFI
jgi:hypothetical protein